MTILETSPKSFLDIDTILIVIFWEKVVYMYFVQICNNT